MKLINPSGKKTITLETNESQEIFLEDIEPGNRDFELTIELTGENAECHIKGRAQTQNSDKKHWKITQNFSGKNQNGSIDVKGISEDEGFLNIDGAAVLKQSSSQASAHISEKVMLFGNGKGKLLPVLRVETDDVAAASHGASIAPVEPEKILYFLSRGIPKTEAEKIVKEGFLSE